MTCHTFLGRILRTRAGNGQGPTARSARPSSPGPVRPSGHRRHPQNPASGCRSRTAVLRPVRRDGRGSGVAVGRADSHVLWTGCPSPGSSFEVGACRWAAQADQSAPPRTARRIAVPAETPSVSARTAGGASWTQSRQAAKLSLLGGGCRVGEGRGRGGGGAAAFGRRAARETAMARRGGHVNHVAAVAQVLPQQGRNGLGHVETVRVQRKIELPGRAPDAHAALPKRPHRMQPLDQQIARSLTTARPDTDIPRYRVVRTGKTRAR